MSEALTWASPCSAPISANSKTTAFRDGLSAPVSAYGYAWVLGRHWNLEAEIGLGYSYTRYSQFKCAGCGKKLKSNRPQLNTLADKSRNQRSVRILTLSKTH